VPPLTREILATLRLRALDVKQQRTDIAKLLAASLLVEEVLKATAPEGVKGVEMSIERPMPTACEAKCPTGAALRCSRRTGHIGAHRDRDFQWSDGPEAV
jgi:hypothetical protein